MASTLADGQAVIVLADSGNVTVLNGLGTRIWQLSDGLHNVEQIVQTIVDEFEVEQATAFQDTIGFLEEMVGLQAVVFQERPNEQIE